MHVTECGQTMETKLKRIEALSRSNPRMEFDWLIQHFTKENLTRCFLELDGKKAKGIDGISKEEYGKNLEENLESLIERMKKMDYYPAPVREVMIPKGDGKFRPLGISNIEDKIVQMMFAKILSAIYEPIFIPESFGFRPKRSCHDAVANVHKHLSARQYGVVIDVDLSNFFGTINHRKLIQLLEIKIKDRVFIRYIVRMLKAGVLSAGELKLGEDGTPQGSIVSPVLANIFAHYAIDIWIKTDAKKLTDGPIHMVRYADDFVICVNRRDALAVLEKLKERLDRFSLIINSEKTKIVDFNNVRMARGQEQGEFKFLGFIFYLGKSRAGRILVKIRTNRKTFTQKLKAITEWCKTTRNKLRLKKLWQLFIAKIRGHIQYYGVSHNLLSISKFVMEAKRIFFKWINRRSQRRSFDWEKFNMPEFN